MDLRDAFVLATYVIFLTFALGTVWTKYFMRLTIKLYDHFYQKTLETLNELDDEDEFDSYFDTAIKDA